MPYKLEPVEVKAPSALVADRITEPPVLAYSFTFQAPNANTGFIYIGDADVSATDYIFQLDADASVTIAAPQVNGVDQELDLSDYYTLASVATDVVAISKMVRKN